MATGYICYTGASTTAANYWIRQYYQYWPTDGGGWFRSAIDPYTALDARL